MLLGILSTIHFNFDFHFVFFALLETLIYCSSNFYQMSIIGMLLVTPFRRSRDQLPAFSFPANNDLSAPLHLGSTVAYMNGRVSYYHAVCTRLGRIAFVSLRLRPDSVPTEKIR